MFRGNPPDESSTFGRRPPEISLGVCPRGGPFLGREPRTAAGSAEHVQNKSTRELANIFENYVPFEQNHKEIWTSVRTADFERRRQITEFRRFVVVERFRSVFGIENIVFERSSVRC